MSVELVISTKIEFIPEVSLSSSTSGCNSISKSRSCLQSYWLNLWRFYHINNHNFIDSFMLYKLYFELQENLCIMAFLVFLKWFEVIQLILSHILLQNCCKKQVFYFLLSGESPYLNIYTLSYVRIKRIELNCLYKHVKKIRSSQ